MYSIYAFQNKVNDRIYVGQSVQPEVRLRQHRKSLRENKHHNLFFQRAWNEYGEAAFEHFIVCSMETKEEADDAEKFFIKWYKELGLAYNHTDGGDGGNTVTDENREAIRAKLKGRPSPNKGKKASEETRKKLSESHMGQSRPHTPEQTAKIVEANKANWTPERRAAFGHSKIGNKNFEGKTHSEETKQKMSEAKKGQRLGIPSSQTQKEAASRTWKGVKRGPMSEVTKQKLREARARQTERAKKA